MNVLDRFIPTPRLLEVNHVDLALSPERAWKLVRHTNLARAPAIRALFSLRTLSEAEPLVIDDIVSTPEKPGFGIFADDPPRSVAVGAIGKVWKIDIPFLHLDPAAFASFAEPDWVKVAWSIEVTPLGERDARVTVEVRVDATDDASWKKFRRYFALIGPFSRFIRRSLLASLAREFGTPEEKEKERTLPGDDLLPDARYQATDGITIDRAPEKIWPWLVQLGCHRAGYYSWDILDNGNQRSAREIHPELQTIAVGDVLPATPKSKDGFEVLRIDPNRTLVLGGLFDPEANKQLPFSSKRPSKFWQVTWMFHLEPQSETRTRLHVRARAVNEKGKGIPLMGRAHPFMQAEQLRNLKARAEGNIARDDWRDVALGASGAAIMLAALLTPFLRNARSHWGLDERTASRNYPGDDLVPNPRWMWTHGIEIEAKMEDVWPWIAQIGADHAGFYSYQFLENIIGCNVHDAERIHPEWEHHVGDALILHPKAPPLPIEAMAQGRWFVAHGRPAPGKHWVEASWLFFLEPLGSDRCRLISRYRCTSSDDLVTRLEYGIAGEPIGFAMDRRMLLGVKERAEGAHRHAA